MENRNITFNLPADLIQKAKVYAAGQGITVNALVRKLLNEKVSDLNQVRSAANRFLDLARSGANSPVDPASIHREELYER